MIVVVQQGQPVIVRDDPDQVVIVSQSGPPGSGGGGGGGGVTDGDKGDIVVTASGEIWTIKTSVLESAGTGTMANHIAAEDPHSQYALDTDLSSAIATHVAAADPHSQYALDTDLSAAIANHIAAADPHSQYVLDTDLSTQLSNAIATHVAAADPHSQYVLDTDLSTQLSNAIATHTAAADPHSQYALETELSSAIANHIAAADPHSQYALDTDLSNAIATREPTINAGTASQYWRGDKSWQTLNAAAVGLGNVNNTADNQKPIFTNTVRGLVPPSGGGTSNFLRADGSWAPPPSSGGGSPGGSDRQFQFNNAGSFAGSAKLVADVDGNPSIIASAFNTAAPSAESGRLKLFSRTTAGRSLLSVAGGSGLDFAMQPHLALNTVRIIKATTLGSTALTNICFPAAIAAGTATAASYTSTNLFTRTSRVGYLSAATAASQCGLRTVNGSTASGYIRFGRDGFFTVVRFGIIATVEDRQLFVGLHALQTALPTGNPSSSTNVVCLGMDSTDTNLQIIHNDGSGTATKVDLGSLFPAPTPNVDFYELRLFQAPGSSSVGWYVENLHNGTKTEGQITTDIPDIDTRLSLGASLSNGATAAAVQIGINSFYVETDF